MTENEQENLKNEHWIKKLSTQQVRKTRRKSGVEQSTKYGHLEINLTENPTA